MGLSRAFSPLAKARKCADNILLVERVVSVFFEPITEHVIARPMLFGITFDATENCV